MLRQPLIPAVTYDDVLLVPGESKVLPSQVDTSTQFTTGLTLAIPLVSSSMDTVTEAPMAIALARAGGIGVLHRSLPPEAQAHQVEVVKRAENIIITNPMTVHPDATVGDVQQLMTDHNVNGIPIVDENGKLLGIVTTRDLRFVTNRQKRVTDVMTKKLITVSSSVSEEEARQLMYEHRIEKLLVIDREGKLAGLMTFRDIEQRARYPHASKDAKGHLLVAAGVGTDPTVMDRVTALVTAGVDAIVVDTAHGHSQRVLDTVKAIRKAHPNLQLIAGNIATPEAAKALIKLDVNAVKVGIGPGSICTTRVVAGIGVPQLSAIQAVADVAQPAHIPVIADGGIKHSGDIVKALAAGASTVMLGSLFAGTDESPGERVFYQGRHYKMYRGMGSLGAMMKGSRDRYFQDMQDDEFNLEQKLVPEGIEGRVAYRGSVASTVFQLIGGLRAGMGYVGAAAIPELYEKSQFVAVTQAGLRESHPHDVEIVREAPNYRP